MSTITCVLFVFSAILVFLFPGTGRAQTNPDPSFAYSMQVIDAGNCERPRLNNAGEVVYTKRTGDQYQVWSSIRGRISAGPMDRDPDINDDGEIIWRFGDGGQGANGIASSSRGTLYSSTGQNPYYDSQRINSSGEVVCSVENRIYSLTRGNLSSPPTGSDRDSALNNLGEVVYRAYRWTGPAFSIQSTVQGVLFSLDSSYLGYPAINDAGEVVWTDQSNVWSSTRGVIRTATNLDSRLAINAHGEVVWVEDRQVFSSIRGQLTHDSVFKSRPDINDRGEVAWLNDDGSIGLLSWAPIAPRMLPPRVIGSRAFTARWAWVREGAPEGELSVASDALFKQPVPGYEACYVVNSTECQVTNLLRNVDYWYRVRRLASDGSHGPWSARMKVRTGKGIPVWTNLLGEGTAARGVTQEFAISNLVAGSGTVKVKSSDPNAIQAGVSDGILTVQYLWKTTNTAKLTLTLTHPATGYKASYGVTVNRATGKVAILGQSALIREGTRVAQDITLENQTGGMVYGVRVRATGLDNAAWLINKTGLDPVSKEAIREIPCVLPPGSQMVARLVYNKAYKTQAATRPVQYVAWAILAPVNGAIPPNGEITLSRQALYDGLWLLTVPVNGNRLYTICHSDDDGGTWVPDPRMIRATANDLMWLDMDEAAPAERIYKVLDSGM
jgi:hypothetical protein